MILRHPILPAARLTCERCHGNGYEDVATKIVGPSTATSKIVDLETNRMPTLRRKLGLTIVQGIEQQAGLELVSKFGIGKAVDETLNSHLFRGKANRRHDAPPKRLTGLKSLAVVCTDSRDPRYRIIGLYQGIIHTASAHDLAAKYFPTRCGQLLFRNQNQVDVLDAQQKCRRLCYCGRIGVRRRPVLSNFFAIFINRVTRNPVVIKIFGCTGPDFIPK